MTGLLNLLEASAGKIYDDNCRLRHRPLLVIVGDDKLVVRTTTTQSLLRDERSMILLILAARSRCYWQTPEKRRNRRSFGRYIRDPKYFVGISFKFAIRFVLVYTINAVPIGHGRDCFVQ